MVEVVIVEPNITQEENEENLREIMKVIELIAQEINNAEQLFIKAYF